MLTDLSPVTFKVRENSFIIETKDKLQGGVTERMCLCSLRMNRSFPYGLDEKGISGKNNIYAKA